EEPRGNRVFICLLVMLMARAEVQVNFSPECKEFLYMGTPPQGLQDKLFKKICQSYNGKPRFVTLYDTVDRIPVYSAYTFKRSDGSKKVDVPWMFEPQVGAAAGFFFSLLECHRHFPQEDLHQSFAHPDDKAATYTLTNVVPQAREFNIGAWKRHEHTIRRRLNNYCRGIAYVVTGVTTSGHMIRRHNMNRVGIPTYLWSAYCCIDFDHNAPYDVRSKFPAYASHGLNDKENDQVQEMSVQHLEDFLKRETYVGKSFQLFYDNCVPPQDPLRFP
uniref:Zgc:172339 n=1 Tax=Myripristis murdjan TaxID=586833 RepID=A0A667YJP0_9TELE